MVAFILLASVALFIGFWIHATEREKQRKDEEARPSEGILTELDSKEVRDE
jgi:hypothetical protein